MKTYIEIYGIDVQCIRYSLRDVYGRLHFTDITQLFNTYDFIAIDGTYEEDGKDSISLFEDMISEDTSIAKRARIFLGKDVVQYALPEDEYAQELIRRCKKLPNVVYGGEGNTKVQAIKKCIKQYAQDLGVVVDDKLPSGIARPEIIQYSNGITTQLSKLVYSLNNLYHSANSQVFTPQNEEERWILKDIERIKKETMRDIHKFGQINARLRIKGQENKEQK